MRDDVHLEIGTRVVSLKDGSRGTVATPHYLARPAHHEVCVAWDGSPPGTSDCVPRAEIDFEKVG